MNDILAIDLSPIWINCGVCDEEVAIRDSVGWPWDNGEPVIDGTPTDGYRCVCLACERLLEQNQKGHANEPR